MSKVSENFKQVIKNYLDKRAAEDELFALTYKKEKKRGKIKKISNKRFV
jgi:hypothetical protein